MSNSKLILLQKLKNEGNDLFVKKDFKTALLRYEESLKIIDITIPREIKSKSSDMNEMFKVLTKNDNENNVLLLKIEISKVFSNRAECYIRLKKYDDAIYNSSLSLHFNPQNEKSVFRRAKSYHMLGELTSAYRDYTRLLQINPNNKSGIQGIKKVGSEIESKGDRTLLYKNAINKLNEELKKSNKLKVLPNSKNKNKSILSNIGIVMNQISHSRDYLKDIVEQKFSHILSELVLHPHQNEMIRIECMRALIVCLKHFTLKDSFDFENQKLILNAFKCSNGLKERNIKIGFIWKFMELAKSILKQLTENQYKTTTEECENDYCDNKVPNKLMQYILIYLIRIASNKYLFKDYCDKIFVVLKDYLKFIYVPPSDIWNKTKKFELKNKLYKFNQQQKQEENSNEINNINNRNSRKEDEKNNVEYNNNTSDNSIQNNKIDDLKKLLQLKTKNKLNLMKEDLDAKYKLNISIIKVILRELSQIAISNSTDNSKLLENLRYHFLIFLLFSDFSDNLKLRNHIIRCLVCFSGLKSAYDELTDKRLIELQKKYNENIKDFIKRPLVSALKTKNITSGNIELVKALRGLSLILQSNYKLGCNIASNEEILNLLIEVCTLDNINEKELKYLGCQVLSLACSHQTIRKSIIEARHTHLFAWILDINQHFVRSHAANALAKFAIVDDDARELALGGPNRCLYSVMEVIWTFLQEEKILNKNYNNKNNKNKLTFIDINDLSEEKEEFDSYKLPLMNLCIETISYLSLHYETKLAITAKDCEIFRILSELENSRYFKQNRAIRHGLLTMILNCSLSKKSALKTLTAKEKQIYKLKKICSKGLPNNPVKEDELIHSRAGKKKDIFKIQELLIDANCVHLMYEIIKSTNIENKKIDNYLKDEINTKENMTHANNKFSKESSFKLQENLRYKPIELEHNIQLKIANVLNMFADKNNSSRNNMKILNKIRGKLIQQNGIRLLLDLYLSNINKYNEKNEKVRLLSSTAISRICISINPTLFNVDHLYPMIVAILNLIKTGNHELYIYEGLLALCNLCSLNDDVRNYVIFKDGWNILRNAFEEEHEQINGAILEVWCNLCISEKGIEQLMKNCDVDIKIVTLFIRHSSLRIQIAVLNILVMLSQYNNDGCKYIAKYGGVVLLNVLLKLRINENNLLNINNNLDKLKYDKSIQIIERIKMALNNLSSAGYSINNIHLHGVNNDLLNEFQNPTLYNIKYNPEDVIESKQNNNNNQSESESESED